QPLRRASKRPAWEYLEQPRETISISDSHFSSSSIPWNRKHHLAYTRGEAHPTGRPAADNDLGRLVIGPIDRQFHLAPPRSEASFRRCEFHLDRSLHRRARKVLAKNDAFFVVERVAIVKVNGPAAVGTRIHAELKR